MVRDPVCGMDVNESLAIKFHLFAQHAEHTYYFCSDDCRDQFERDPELFSGTGAPWFEDGGESTMLDMPPT